MRSESALPGSRVSSLIHLPDNFHKGPMLPFCSAGPANSTSSGIFTRNWHSLSSYYIHNSNPITPEGTKSRKHIRYFLGSQAHTDRKYSRSNHTETLRNPGQSGLRYGRVSQEGIQPSGQGHGPAVTERLDWGMNSNSASF